MTGENIYMTLNSECIKLIKSLIVNQKLNNQKFTCSRKMAYEQQKLFIKFKKKKL